MASTVIDPIAAGIKTVAAAVTATGSVTVKAFKWAPNAGDTDRLPAAVVYTPRVTRTAVGPDIPEDHLGSRDFYLDYPVHFYFDADDREFAAAQIAEVIEGFVNAIDSSLDVGGGLNSTLAADAKVTEADEPIVTERNNRTIWEVRTRVQVVAFV